MPGTVLEAAASIPQEPASFDLYRTYMAPLWDIQADIEPAAPFDWTTRLHHLGRAVVGRARAPGHVSERTDAHAARMAIDHLLVVARNSGRADIDLDPGERRSIGNAVSILDLSRPFRASVTEVDVITLALPRALIAPLVTDGAGTGDLGDDGARLRRLGREVAQRSAFPRRHRRLNRQSGWLAFDRRSGMEGSAFMAYKGEVRLIAGTYAPAGWTMCTGGSGIPDLRGRVVIHAHAAAPLGEMGGAETVPLIAAELLVHRHVAMCAGDAITSTPVQGFWAAITTKKFGTLCRSACRSGYDGVVLYHAGG